MDAEEIDRLVHLSVESYNQRDPELMIEHWDPECEWHPYFSAQVEGSKGYRGHDGVRQWFRDLDEMFSSITWEVEKVRDLGDDRFLILGQLRACGRTSGAEVDSEIGQLLEVRGERLLRGWAYFSHDQARRAAGLDT
jgi:ketosteroid isomerase-like protein